MVEATGCGCPVDTSVLSTEAPTEAAAETLNPYELPHTPLKRATLAVPKISFGLERREILTAAPSSPRFIVRRTRFGDDASRRAINFVNSERTVSYVEIFKYERNG